MKLLYQYSAGDSFLHRLDPRTKLIFIFCYLIIVLVIPDIRFIFSSLILVMLILWFAGDISPKEYWPILALFVPLVIAITLVQAFTRGPPYCPLPIISLRLSKPGYIFGLTIGLRLMTMGMTYALFAMTTDPFEISLALSKMGIDFKYSYFVGFALRFFPLIQEELTTIASAARARAYSSIYSRNPISMLKGLVSIMPCLALCSIRRSQNIALAMELRGFSALSSGRTFLKEIKFRLVDYVVTIISLIYLFLGLFIWITIFEGLKYLGGALILIALIIAITPFLLIPYIYTKRGKLGRLAEIYKSRK